MFEKLGVSLAREYDVHVIGYARANARRGRVRLYMSIPLTFQENRLRPGARVFNAQGTVLRLRPDVLIICTHELLVDTARGERAHGLLGDL